MHLFCFGLGYTALYLTKDLLETGWRVSGTTTKPEKVNQLKRIGIDAVLFSDQNPIEKFVQTYQTVTHVLVSIPPINSKDVALEKHVTDLKRLGELSWVGYLSTTGVYGDCQGELVDENTPLNPQYDRAKDRAKVEKAWLEAAKKHKLPVHIFRLSGIYGPGRSAIDKVKNGQPQLISKPDHVMNRIHVADIVGTLKSSMEQAAPGEIYNVSDNEPCGTDLITQYAYELMGKAAPKPIPFEKASLSDTGKAFYSECKRVNNDKIKEKLGYNLKYPSYREGLKAVYQETNL